MTKSALAPYVSDDNPYSGKPVPDHEAAGISDRFGSIRDSRAFGLHFFPWYNDDHRHSALGLMTPAMVHYNLAPQVREQRQRILDAAYLAHPERFVHQPPQAPQLQQEVWINKPAQSEKESL